MKKVPKTIMLLCLTVFLMLSLTACTKGNDIVGYTWESTNITPKLQIQFNKDHTATVTAIVYGMKYPDNGTWSEKGSNITVSVGNDVFDLEFDDNELIGTISGTRATFIKK